MITSVSRGPLGVLLVALSVAAAPAEAGIRPIDEIDHAFARFYNFDFAGAHAVLNAYIAAHPDDPLAYAVRSAVYLYTEFDRLGILESEFFSDDAKITDKRKVKPDPENRRLFFGAVEDARDRIRSRLAAKPEDYHAMFAACMVEGLLGDYTALVEKKQLGSLSSDKRSNTCAQNLLKSYPDAYDAYVTTGFTEYLVGALPFYVRWFVHFDDVKGSKEQGIANLQVAARSGHYLRSFAKVLLAVVYLREKRPGQAREMLAELVRDYPENRVFRTELIKISSRAQAAAAGTP
jgi:hypothetical protein